MVDSKKIKWAYPFSSKGTTMHPIQYLMGLANARGGLYPLGENGLWHGGIHFDQGTADIFDQSSLRCIADGEVIAYRVDDTYPFSEHAEDATKPRRLPFSSSFVLVKHALRPASPDATASASNESSIPELTFFSLYMHLLDWAGYKAREDLARPEFWEKASHIVDTQNGGLNVRATPQTNGTILAQLAKGSEIVIAPAEGGFSKLVSIISGAAEPNLTPDNGGQLPGYVATQLLKAQHAPKDTDQVVVLDQPIHIEAGQLIGYSGIYQNYSGPAQSLVHLEVFSCEDVPGFINRSRNWATSLPEAEKTLLKVYEEASRLIQHRDGMNASDPPKRDDAGSEIGNDLTIPQAFLDGLPAASKIKIDSPAVGSNGPQTNQWWRLEGLFEDSNGNPINGWLAEQDLITTRHSPWEWLDFQCIEDTSSPLEKLAYSFNARDMLDPQEIQAYQAQISNVDSGALLAFARLHGIIGTDKDSKLSTTEIRAALSKPRQAQMLGQLIIRHESEWYWDKSKWDELDPLMEEEPGTLNQAWEKEKQRIEALSWWQELAGKHGISEDGRAWHLHALQLLGTFEKSCDENDLKWLKVERGQLTFDVEGNDIEGSIHFSRIAHWPPVGDSGITLGRGYDIGQQPNVESDLKNIGIVDPFLSWIVGGQGKRRAEAGDYLAAASEASRQHQITRKQQHQLFVFTYNLMEADVKRISTNSATLNRYYPAMVGRGEEAWAAIENRIKDLMVDLRYRGDYKPATREKLQEACYKNDFSNLKQIMRDEGFWVSAHNVPRDRFNRRRGYVDAW